MIDIVSEFTFYTISARPWCSVRGWSAINICVRVSLYFIITTRTIHEICPMIWLWLVMLYNCDHVWVCEMVLKCRILWGLKTFTSDLLHIIGFGVDKKVGIMLWLVLDDARTYRVPLKCFQRSSSLKFEISDWGSVLINQSEAGIDTAWPMRHWG